MPNSSSSKTIAFVSDAIYPYNKAGKDKRLYEITIRLAQRGHDVHIYTMKWWNGDEKVRIENGVYLHAISKKRSLYSKDKRSIPQALFYGFACLKLITAKFDVIDVDHMPYFPLFAAWVVCLFRRKRFYATWHEVWGAKYWREYMGLSGTISAFIERITILLPRNIISVSEHTSKRLINNLNYRGPLATIPNGINFDEITHIRKSTESNDAIYAGRLIKHKNVDLIVKAIAKCKSDGKRISCLIVGEGPEKENLIRLASDLNVEDQICFRDFYRNHNELYALIKSSKLFAFPSSREGFGIAAIEANACGIPVITMNGPDNAAKELIHEGVNGFLINDLKELSSRMASIIEQKTIRARDCIESVEKYDWRAIVDSLLEAYAL